MISVLATTVQTSGINWASVLTIICSIVVSTSIILGFVMKFVANTIATQVTSSIDHLRIDVLAKMDLRISLLEQANMRRKKISRD